MLWVMAVSPGTLHLCTNRLPTTNRFRSQTQLKSAPLDKFVTDGRHNDVDLLDRLHQHLKIVFSLRSFPNGNTAQGESDVTDEELSSFFLPSIEEGRAYIKCYFDHVCSFMPAR